MPATYCSLHYHAVFSTKDRYPLITKDWRDNLHAYLGGIVKNLGGVPLAIGGIEDHAHVLMGLRATHAIANVMRDVKADLRTGRIPLLATEALVGSRVILA